MHPVQGDRAEKCTAEVVSLVELRGHVADLFAVLLGNLDVGRTCYINR